MGGPTSIEWAEHSWNPIVGCGVLSPGCTNCYAMTMAARIEAMNAALPPGHGESTHYAGTTRKVNGKAVWTGKLALAGDDVLLAPVRRKKPTTYFVNSMGDLFHEDCPDAWIDRVFAVMALCPQHTFQVLTKRAARMQDYCGAPDIVDRVWSAADRISAASFARRDQGAQPGELPWPLRNVWLGVSTEDQKRADERIPHLLATPAAVRFISAEPLLGAIDLTAIRWHDEDAEIRANALTAEAWVENSESASAYTNEADGNTKLDWVIVGGESGPDARPMHPDCARGLRDQCAAAGVAFFFKQWGAWEVALDRDRDDPDWRADYSCRFADRGKYKWLNLEGGCGFHGERFYVMRRVGKKAAGRLLDGVAHSAMPEVRA